MSFARVVVACAGAAALAACSSTQWNEMTSNPREYFNRTSPTLRSDARIDGQQITLKRGQALVVRLDEDLTTGLRWEMKPLPVGAVIAPVQHDYVPKSDSAAPASATSGEALFRVRGVAYGTQTVVLEHKRAFEPAVDKTVRFDVVVR